MTLFARPILPQRLPPPELLTPGEMGRADAEAARFGAPARVLMANAGRAVARAARRRFPRGRVVVLCGPGNNGGDGYIAARLLHQLGWPVAVAALAPPRAGSDAAWAASLWNGAMAPFAPASVSRADLVLDGVFGAGLARDVEGIVADTLRAARRVLAIDIPSGVDGGSAAVRGYAPSAETTVTFFRYKPGHLMLPGRDLCGVLELADIGIPDAVLAAVPASASVNRPGLWQLPSFGSRSHKYSRGHVTVLGGAEMTGAARLAAAAARRVGAGLVTVAASRGTEVYRTGEPGLIVSDAPLSNLLADERRHVWVCGPGLGQNDARSALPVLLAAGRTVVADADALTAFAGDPGGLRGVAVMTPHAGEFARVFGPPGADRLTAARKASRRSEGVVLLKGSDTIVAAPDGRATINASAPPWLATAGTGDVLAGLIAGLLAQGLAPFEAAAAAAWVHGRAAAIAGRFMVVEDLLSAIPSALAETAAITSRRQRLSWR